MGLTGVANGVRGGDAMDAQGFHGRHAGEAARVEELDVDEGCGSDADAHSHGAAVTVRDNPRAAPGFARDPNERRFAILAQRIVLHRKAALHLQHLVTRDG